MTNKLDAQATRQLSLTSSAGRSRGSWGVPTLGSRGAEEQQLNLVGQVIAERYRVIEPLTRGGMGAIYRAEHVTIGRPLALKVLRPKFSGDSKVMQRFLQEARVTSQIRQENVIDIIDFGYAPDGIAYLAMELLEGEDLLKTLKRDGPLPWARLGPMVMQICAALDAAHRMGVIHRDMKPSNCFRLHHAGNPDFIKVLDFGVAKLLYGDENDKPVTAYGTVVGTPMYLPPEVAHGSTPTPKFDIYALGVTMYQLLTGCRPYRGKVSLEMLKASVLSDPIPPSQANPNVTVAPEVEAVVLRAMEKDPGRRFGSAQALATAVMSTLSVGKSLNAWSAPTGYSREVVDSLRRTPAPGPTSDPPVTTPSDVWTLPSSPVNPHSASTFEVDDEAVTQISTSSSHQLLDGPSADSTSHGVPPSPGDVARGFETDVGAQASDMRWRPATDDRAVAPAHEAPSPAVATPASHELAPAASHSFSASESTLGVSDVAGHFGERGEQAVVHSGAQLPAATGVSRKQLVLAVAAAGLMMLVGVGALLFALLF